MILYVMITGCTPAKLRLAPNADEYLSFLFENYNLSHECKDLLSKLLTKGKRSFDDFFNHPFLQSQISESISVDDTNYSCMLSQVSEQPSISNSFVVISEPQHLTNLESTISCSIQPCPLKYVVTTKSMVIVRFKVTQGKELFQSYNLILTCSKQKCNDSKATSIYKKFSLQQIENNEAFVPIDVDEQDVPCKITASVSLSSWLSYFTSCSVQAKFVITMEQQQ